MIGKIVTYSGVTYGVFDIIHRNRHYPIVVDKKDYDYINNMKQKWHIKAGGAIQCSVNINGKTRDICMHDLIMSLKQVDSGQKIKPKSIIHINKIHMDNRRDNLIYDDENKPINKNMNKKRRTLKLPRNSGIRKDEIPTYVWYVKPDRDHGERFLVEIGDIRWKSSSSVKYTLRYKLEEAKKFLRKLRIDKPELFREYSMNGDYNEIGDKLLKSFVEIVKLANYQVSNLPQNNQTDQYLKMSNDLDTEEANMLKD